MKTRLIEITFIVGVLLLLALAVGCKDKAEAREHFEGQIVNLDKTYIFNGYDYVPVFPDKPKDKIDDPICDLPKPEIGYIDCAKHGKNEYIRYYDGFKEYRYCKRCYGEFLNKSLAEIIRDTELPTLEANEPVSTEVYEGMLFYDTRKGIEPEKRTWIFDGDKFIQLSNYEPNEGIHILAYAGETYLDKPNEPKCKHINPSNTILTCYHTDGSYCWQCPDCGVFINSISGEYGNYEPEPNEPEITDDQQKISKWQEALSYEEVVWESPLTAELNLNVLIPTWPDYIELEKDLVIDATIDPNYPFTIEIGKGAKIYFREN